MVLATIAITAIADVAHATDDKAYLPSLCRWSWSARAPADRRLGVRGRGGPCPGGQVRDASWADAVETELRTAAVTEGSRLISAECQATICRMEVEHDTGDAQEARGSHPGLSRGARRRVRP